MKQLNIEQITSIILNKLSLDYITSIYLFGSCKEGTHNDASDIDLIVISDTFNGFSNYIRRKVICTNFDNFPINIDPVCMTPDEFFIYSQCDTYQKEKPKLIYRKDTQLWNRT